ncbi:MAG: winged helix-turn-helix domain-containing protein [Candidatus Aenigmarchaeota archaeon]|nr:winged helix-turn-helix domain-containing protein [Candidatus Aenigmarchaeota archaeon]
MPQIHFSPFRVDPNTGQLWEGEREEILTPRALEVLLFLIEHKGETFTGVELLKAIWGNQPIDESNVRVCIKELRDKLGDEGLRIIRHIPGRGYCFIEPVMRTRGQQVDERATKPFGSEPRDDTVQIFISYYGREIRIANALKEFLHKKDSLRRVEVLVLGRTGRNLYNDILTQLNNSRTVLFLPLLSHHSMPRLWVNLEFGAAISRQFRLHLEPDSQDEFQIVPILHRGLMKEDFAKDHPCGHFPALYLTVPEDTKRREKMTPDDTLEDTKELIETIEEVANTNYSYTDKDYQEFIGSVEALGLAVDEEVYSNRRRDTVRFYLYSKSTAQLRRNQLEVGEHLLFNFRKSDINEVFQSLLRDGYPEMTIISLDEYWAKELAEYGERGRLIPLTLPDFSFLDTLEESSKSGNSLWSIPHFLDFSFYTCLERDYEELSAWLREVKELSDQRNWLEIQNQIESLRNRTGTRHLLEYDFNTADTRACVILEFIQSFGDGIESLLTPATAISEKNIIALKILREMVGNRPNGDFADKEPRDLRRECNQRPFLREWHARMSDLYKVIRMHHKPIIECPLVGTLGGWHVGILKGSRRPAEGISHLTSLVSEGNQEARFRANAGLPTLRLFYIDPDKRTWPDEITGWTLADIAGFAKGLIKRSGMTPYSVHRDKLIRIHESLMKYPLHEIENNMDRIFEIFDF